MTFLVPETTLLVTFFVPDTTVFVTLAVVVIAERAPPVTALPVDVTALPVVDTTFDNILPPALVPLLEVVAVFVVPVVFVEESNSDDDMTDSGADV